MPESVVRVKGGIVADRIRIVDIVLDRRECSHLTLPGSRTVQFSPSTRRKKLEGFRGFSVFHCIFGGDYIDGNAFVYRDGSHVVWSDYAGIVRSIREQNHGLLAAYLCRVPEGEQQSVIYGCVIAGDHICQSNSWLSVLISQRKGPPHVLAERIDGYGVHRIQLPHEIGDGIARVHQGTVHTIARIEKNEDIASGCFQPVTDELHGRFTSFGKSRDPLRCAVFENSDVLWLQSTYGYFLCVQHIEGEHDHVDTNPEIWLLRPLRMHWIETDKAGEY